MTFSAVKSVKCVFTFLHSFACFSEYTFVAVRILSLTLTFLVLRITSLSVFSPRAGCWSVQVFSHVLYVSTKNVGDRGVWWQQVLMTSAAYKHKKTMIQMGEQHQGTAWIQLGKVKTWGGASCKATATNLLNGDGHRMMTTIKNKRCNARASEHSCRAT